MSRDYRQPDESLVSIFRSNVMPLGANKLIVSPTRLSPERLGMSLIEAFADTPADFLLLTYEGDVNYTFHCKRLAERLGVAGRVLICPEVPQSQILVATAAADVALIFHDHNGALGNFFCHPSRLAYCVALGTPVLANDVPSISSDVYKYNLGRCVQLCNRDHFVRELVHMTSDRTALQGWRTHLREVFLNHFCFEREAVPLCSLVRQLTAVERY